MVKTLEWCKEKLSKDPIHFDTPPALPPEQLQELVSFWVQEFPGGYLAIYDKADWLHSVPNAQALLASAAQNAADKNPKWYFSVYRDSPAVRDLPHAEETLAQAVQSAIKNDLKTYFFAYRNIPDVRDLPNAEETLAQAVQSAVENNPKSYFDAYENIPGISALPNAQKTWLDAVKSSVAKQPGTYFYEYENNPQVRDLPDAEKMLVQAIESAVENEPEFYFDAYRYIPKVRTLPNAQETLLQAAKSLLRKDPGAYVDIYRYSTEFPAWPDAREMLSQAARSIAVSDPRDYFDEYHNNPKVHALPDAKETLALAVESAANNHLASYFSEYEGNPDVRALPHAIETLLQATNTAATKQPISYFNAYENLSDVRTLPNAKELLARAANTAAENEHYLYLSVYKNIPDIRTLPKAKELLAVVAKSMAEENPLRYFIAYEDIPDIRTLPNAAETLAVAVRGMPEKPVWLMNQLHEEPDAKRFAILESLQAKDLFFLIGEGREEMFTSTFNGTLTRLLAKLSEEHKTFLDLAQSKEGKPLLPIVMQAAAEYDRVGDVLKSLPDDRTRAALIQQLFDGVSESFSTVSVSSVGEMSSVLRPSIALADTIKEISDPQLRGTFERYLVDTYQHAQGNAKIGLGLVISSYLGGASPQNPALFQSENFSANYPITNINRLSDGLFDKQGRHVEQVFFYADDDGKASYQHMLEGYRKDSRYKIEDHEGFVAITRKEGNRQFLLVANKPEEFKAEVRPRLEEDMDAAPRVQQDSNVDIASAYLQSIDATPSIIIHRGHSYHVPQTMKHLTPGVKAVFWGSCGGYQNIAKTLDIAPDAQVLVTKGTGSKFVNDPLFTTIQDDIMRYGMVQWDQIWSPDRVKQMGVDQRYWEQYVRPDENAAAQFVTAYKKLLAAAPPDNKISVEQPEALVDPLTPVARLMGSKSSSQYRSV